MSDYRIVYDVIEDDGSDGTFWRNGERVLREHGVEKKMLDLSPALEGRLMVELDLYPKMIPAMQVAKKKSLDKSKA
jgi:hypothetical protein